MSQPSYEIKRVRDEDISGVMDLLRRTFFLDEPINQSVGLFVDDTCQEVEEFCLGVLRAGFSLMAVDKEGNVISALINEICSLKEDTNNGQDFITMAQRCQNPKFQKILYVLAARDENAKIWARFPHEERLMGVKIAATDHKWRRQGIMTELLKAIEKLTIQMGIKLLRIDTSSAYSAKVAEKLGYICIHAAAYKDIKKDGRPILVPELPHVEDRVYVKLLNECGGEATSLRSYEIKPVREEDTNDIMDLLRRTFFIDEPMNQAVGLFVDGTCRELDEYCLNGLKAGLSFKAVDKEGNIVGAMVNGICPLKEDTDSGHDFLTMAQKCQNPKFQKILYVLAKREESAKIWEKFPDEQQAMDVKIAATDPNWRKRGIMNELLQATEKLTVDRGIRLLRMDTSSAYSAMVAERLGFTCIHSAAYLDIKMDGRPIIVPEAPHVDDRVYVKRMHL